MTTSSGSAIGTVRLKGSADDLKGGALAWPARRRRLDRLDPSFPE